MFFFSILQLFLQHCLPQFIGVFPEPFSVFRWKFGGLLLLLYIVARFHICWLVSSVVSSFLSMPTTRRTFNSLSVDLFPAPSTSDPPSSRDSVDVSTVASGTLIAVDVAQAFQQSLPSFITAFRPENLATPVSSTALSPVSSIVSSVVSSIVSGSPMVAASLLSSVAGTLRFPPFPSMFPAYVFLHPRLLLGPPGSFDHSFDYGVECYQLFFAWRQATRRLWLARVMHPSRQNW